MQSTNCAERQPRRDRNSSSSRRNFFRAAALPGLALIQASSPARRRGALDSAVCTRLGRPGHDDLRIAALMDRER